MASPLHISPMAI